jgi:uncharacterized protein YceK
MAARLGASSLRIASLLPQFGLLFAGAFSSLACAVGGLMKAVSALLASGILLAGCSQVIDQFYSKENFNMRSFNADISECKEQNPSVVAMHIDAAESREQVDDAMVRECMKAKGYAVQIETK